MNIAGPAPIVSLAPYSSGYFGGGNGAVYTHALPAYGAMGTSHSLSLVYNSSAVRPVSLVAMDVSNPLGALYPSTYQVQVQLNGVFLQLMNGSTSVYYTAGAGDTSTTRMIAAVDAKANGLATGEYPVNIVVSSIYPSGPRTVSVLSRLIVNDQNGSAFGAGVGLAGVPRLYTITGSYGLLLVTGDGALAYFDRTCGTCAFISPPGVSGMLAVYTDTLLRLTALDGSILEFHGNGRVSRHFLLPTIQDLTFGWTDTLLTTVTDASGRAFTLSYTGGKLTQISDPAGRLTKTSISSGQLVKVTDPDSLADSLTLDLNALVTQLNDRAGRVWNYAYNALDEIDSATGPTATDYTGTNLRPVASVTTSGIVIWQPGVAGTSSGAPKANVRPDTVVATAKDPLGRVTKVAVDRFGAATKLVDPIGRTSVITRDTLNHTTQIVEPNGHTRAWTYTKNRLTYVLDNFTQESHTLVYDTASGHLLYVTGGPVRYDFFYHDGTQGPAGTLKMVYAGNTAPYGIYYYPSGGAVAATYYPNSYGQDTLLIDGGGHRSRWVYAASAAGGNLLQAVDPNGHMTSYHYNSYGLTDTTTLVTGAKQSTTYDAMDHTKTIVDPLGHVTQFTNGPLGLSRIVDAKGQVYKFDMSPWGLLLAQHDLGDSTIADVAKYDVGRELRTFKLRQPGDSITLTYDSLGRVITRSGSRPDLPTETFIYGPNSRWVVAANANGRDSVVLNSAGRPIFASQRMPDGTTTYQVTYTYDSHGRLVSRSAPTSGSPTRWVYNANVGTLDTLCMVGTCTAFTRDTEFKPTGLTYSAGQTGAWSHVQVFDSLHRVVRDSFTVSSDFATQWKYDSLARVTNRHSFVLGLFPDEYFAYDADGQLTNMCTLGGDGHCRNEYGGLGTAYQFDAAGNRTDSAAAATIGSGNRVQHFKNYALTYNLNGNLIQKAGLGTNGIWTSTDTTLFQWNEGGQLVRVEKWTGAGAHTIDSLFYDALGRRVAKKTNALTTWFVYDGNQIAMDVDAGSHATIAEYGYSSGGEFFAVRAGSDTLVTITDPMNHTVLGLARARGGAEMKKYDPLATPWSQASADTGLLVRFRMAGEEYDQETGLYHLGARYYDPQLGRFVSEDPKGVAGGLNLYAYAANDPINNSDPSGTSVCYLVQVWQTTTLDENNYGFTAILPDGSRVYMPPGDLSITYLMGQEITCVDAGGNDRGSSSDGSAAIPPGATLWTGTHGSMQPFLDAAHNACQSAMNSFAVENTVNAVTFGLSSEGEAAVDDANTLSQLAAGHRLENAGTAIDVGYGTATFDPAHLVATGVGALPVPFAGDLPKAVDAINACF